MPSPAAYMLVIGTLGRWWQSAVHRSLAGHGRMVAWPHGNNGGTDVLENPTEEIESGGIAALDPCPHLNPCTGRSCNPDSALSLSYRGSLTTGNRAPCSTSSVVNISQRTRLRSDNNTKPPQTILKVPHRWNEEISSPIIGLPPLPAPADPALLPSRLLTTTTAMALLVPP